MVNFSETFDVKFLKKSKSCPKAQQNTLLVLHFFVQSLTCLNLSVSRFYSK